MCLSSRVIAHLRAFKWKMSLCKLPSPHVLWSSDNHRSLFMNDSNYIVVLGITIPFCIWVTHIAIKCRTYRCDWRKLQMGHFLGNTVIMLLVLFLKWSCCLLSSSHIRTELTRLLVVGVFTLSCRKCLPHCVRTVGRSLFCGILRPFCRQMAAS